MDRWLASLSARRAWIEISGIKKTCKALEVALRKESVDRNRGLRFAFRKSLVALRKESVDRNGGLMSVVRFATSSLSARRAWIEIPSSKYAL